MKKYAVFAKKTIETQKPEDYTIWHFLNDTDDMSEAYHWYLHAKDQPETYRAVQIVESIIVIPVKRDGYER